MKHLLFVTTLFISLSTYVTYSQSIQYTPTEKKLKNIGLVDIAEKDSSIKVKLIYSTANNFVGKVLYKDINRAFLLPVVADKLFKAQKLLKQSDSTLSIIVYDATRPISVQREMWKIVEGTYKANYVSNPNKGGGVHNFGAAVDVSIIKSNGEVLDMGTPFDYFGVTAHIDKEEELLSLGKLTQDQLNNRLLLRRIMKSAGFLTITNEWWHFNHMSTKSAREKLKLIDF